LAAVAARIDAFRELDVEILVVSVDSIFVHKMWQESELAKMVDGGVPFAMLTDAGGALGRVYGVYDEEAGVDVRGRFLIDPDGVVQAIEILTPPVGRNVDETLRQLKAFQHVRKTKAAEVCPSGWQPGKKVLKPGPDLVGRVWKEWRPGDE
jgi:peroxiredoxin (alkyl hydroperoxide reductase subunit C)